MKKIILFIIFILSSVAINAQFQVIGIGASANDNTGDPLRTLAQKTNANFAMVQDSLNAALDADDYYWGKTDTMFTHKQVITYDQLMNFQGGGSGVSKDKLQFIVGTTTGSPANGDTILTHTSLIGKEIDFFRGTTADLSKQYFNTTATNGKTGYRFNATTGTITVRPAFSTGDRCLVEGWNPLNVNWLSFSAGASSLLTGLRAGFQLNETSGTQVNDVLSTYTGVTTGTVNQAGKFGVAESFVRTSAQWANMGQSVQDVGTSDFALSAWFNISTSPAATAGIAGCTYDAPYFYMGISSEDKPYAIINFGSGNIILEGSAALSASTWYHMILNVDRSGNATLYIDGSLVDTEDVSAGVAVNFINNNSFAIGAIGNLSGYTWNGSIDEVFVWTKVLSAPEIATLQTQTYPWN